MKTKYLLIIAAATLAFIPSVSMAQLKGAEMLAKHQPVQAAAPVQSAPRVSAADPISMSCPKCKDTYVTVVTKSEKGMRLEHATSAVKHMCPTCATTIQTEGMGKHAQIKLAHTCNDCGSPEMACCTTAKNGGPTPGMENKE